MQREIRRGLFWFWAGLALVAIVLTVVPVAVWEREPLSVFHERRARLVKETGGDGAGERAPVTAVGGRLRTGGDQLSGGGHEAGEGLYGPRGGGAP